MGDDCVWVWAEQVEANRRGILREGGVRGLVGALGKHPSREFVVHGACRALGQLIFDSPRTAQVRLLSHPLAPGAGASSEPGMPNSAQLRSGPGLPYPVSVT